MHQSSFFWVKGEILHAQEGRKEEEAYLHVTLMQFIKKNKYPKLTDLVTCSWHFNLPDWHSNSRANQTMVESLQTCSYH